MEQICSTASSGIIFQGSALSLPTICPAHPTKCKAFRISEPEIKAAIPSTDIATLIFELNKKVSNYCLHFLKYQLSAREHRCDISSPKFIEVYNQS